MERLGQPDSIASSLQSRCIEFRYSEPGCAASTASATNRRYCSYSAGNLNCARLGPLHSKSRSVLFEEQAVDFSLVRGRCPPPPPSPHGFWFRGEFSQRARRSTGPPAFASIISEGSRPAC